MRIKPSTSFPYPVLSPDTGDYANPDFELQVDVYEVPATGSVRIEGGIRLDDIHVRGLIEDGRAKCGLMVTCVDTYLDRFFECSLEGAVINLEAGSVRGSVTLRGVEVAAVDAVDLKSDQINAEFPPHSRVVRKGDLVAVTSEIGFVAGLEKLASLESIFRLSRSDEVQEGRVAVDCDSEAIEIAAGPELYDVIYNLRQNAMKDLLLPAVYLPVVMSAVEAMKDSSYSGRRWHGVLSARCEAEGINPNDDLLTSAQKLLDGPLANLGAVISRAQ